MRDRIKSRRIRKMKSKGVWVIGLVLVALMIYGVVSDKTSSSSYSSNTSYSTYKPSTYNSSNSSYKSSTKTSSSSYKSSSFTNSYGTPTTLCAHPGCTNYISSTGDTNCCTVHSRKCLQCGKYIDEDALYCISCIKAALGSN